MSLALPVQDMIPEQIPLKLVGVVQPHEPAPAVGPPLQPGAVLEAQKAALAALSPKARARVEKWRRIVAQQQASGLSETAFCMHQGMHCMAFYRGKKYAESVEPLSPGRPSTVPDDLFNTFWSYWAQESQPSLSRCWQRTMGEASSRPGFDREAFPSKWAFGRRLVRQIPVTSRYLVRNGFTRFRAKYGFDIRRNYDNMLAGTTWVSDHAQMDVLVIGPDGKPHVPWVTAWMDVKSYKWLGWRHHLEDPNSEHIALAFRDAAVKYGIPSDVILDNGKDYLCRDIAGGRKKIHLPDLEQDRKSIMGGLGIQTHFAAPYNARAKVIERQFRECNSSFSRFCPGYRGPSTTKKPEALKSQVAKGNLLHWQQYCDLFDKFMNDVRPHEQCFGRVHKGRTLEAVWIEEYPKACSEGLVRFVEPQALALFCRKAVTAKIGRNGVRYGALDCWYWGEWMYAHTGETVDLWLDRDDVREPAWVLKAGTVDQFLGEATAMVAVAALAKSDEEKLGLSLAAKAQRSYYKAVRGELPDMDTPLVERALDAQAAFNATVPGNVIGAKAEVEQKSVSLTPMDVAIRAKEKARAREAFDVTPMLPEYTPHEMTRREQVDQMFEELGAEIERDWENRKVASG
jgi:hypothetical protein